MLFKFKFMLNKHTSILNLFYTYGILFNEATKKVTVSCCQ